MSVAVIQGLQVFRGLAALAVVVHHAVLSTNAFVGVVPPPFGGFLGMGFLGVDFFFVLSGFIIMYIHMGDKPSAHDARRYLSKRLSRIFPPYLPVSLAMLVLYAMLPGASESGGREYSLLTSLVLLPADLPPALSVAWTLVHEMQFYAVFLLFFLSGRLLVGFLMLWASLILISNLMFTPVGWARYPLSLLNIEFMFGVLAAWFVNGNGNSGRKPHPPAWLAAGVLLALAALVSITPENASFVRLAFAFGLSLVVVGFVLLEKKQTLPWPATVILLGNASYSIYLIHNPLLSVTQRLAGRFEFGWLVALAGGVVFSVLAGLLYHKAIERPALRFFSKRLRNTPSRLNAVVP